jgi:hypothetical protein
MRPRKLPAARRPRRPAPRSHALRHRRPAFHTYFYRCAPRDEEVPPRRAPYVEIAATVAVLLFVMFVVFGGLQPDARSFTKIEPVSTSLVRSP